MTTGKHNVQTHAKLESVNPGLQMIHGYFCFITLYVKNYVMSFERTIKMY